MTNSEVQKEIEKACAERIEQLDKNDPYYEEKKEVFELYAANKQEEACDKIHKLIRRSWIDKFFELYKDKPYKDAVDKLKFYYDNSIESVEFNRNEISVLYAHIENYETWARDLRKELTRVEEENKELREKYESQ